MGVLIGTPGVLLAWAIVVSLSTRAEQNKSQWPILLLYILGLTVWGAILGTILPLRKG